MNKGDRNNKTNLIDTTDCLEAVGVFRGWKSLLFIVTLLCLLLLQVSFWVLDRGLVKDQADAQTVVQIDAEPKAGAVQELPDANETAVAVTDSNQLAEAQTQPEKVIIDLNLKSRHMIWLIRDEKPLFTENILFNQKVLGTVVVLVGWSRVTASNAWIICVMLDEAR